MVCLGILVDNETRTKSVPPEKLENINRMCTEWQTKKFCSKRELQSLFGLSFTYSKCVIPARAFLNHMLQFIRTIGDKSSMALRVLKVVYHFLKTI